MRKANGDKSEVLWRRTLKLGPVPRSIQLGVIWRTAFLWAGARTLFFMASAGAGLESAARLPGSIIFVVVVISLRASDAKRRKEFLLLENLAISPVYTHAIAGLVAGVLELGLLTIV